MTVNNQIPKWVTNISESDVNRLLESDKEVMRQFANWASEPPRVLALQMEITRLSQEILRLRTVMLSAHAEITEQWNSHCDSEGFGPTNLIRHLKEGTGFYPGFVDELIKGGKDV